VAVQGFSVGRHAAERRQASARTFREGAGHAWPSGERHVGFAGLTLAVCEPVMSSVAIDTDKFIMSHLVFEDFGYSLLPRFKPENRANDLTDHESLPIRLKSDSG
jgi:hypothetical protein